MTVARRQRALLFLAATLIALGFTMALVMPWA